MSFDATAFTGRLPYASELFGVYQPLLGWKSRITLRRVALEQSKLLAGALGQIGKSGPRLSDIRRNPRIVLPIELARHASGIFATATGKAVWRSAQEFQRSNDRLPQGDEWAKLVSDAKLDEIVASVAADEVATDGREAKMIAYSSKKEAVAAGAFQTIATAQPDALTLAATSNKPLLLAQLKYAADPLAAFDPLSQAAVLSPIGLVEIFREYFFEFDTFLGPPVGHVWVSPSGSLELFEIHTRRTTEERSAESSLETISRREVQVVEEDELSTAISRQNGSDISVGISASANADFGVIQGNVSASLGLGFTHQNAQETAHRHARRQSETISNEIRRNFKTTFRTTVATEDTSSRRYVLGNSTDRLVNYELRRKMRRVGVQVQHIGSQLCWQVFIDAPGMFLGVGELVHIAAEADLHGIEPPEAPPTLEPKTSTWSFPFSFDPINDEARDDGEDELYERGKDLKEKPPGKITWKMVLKPPPPPEAPGYSLDSVTITSYTGSNPDCDPPTASTEVEVVPGNKFELRLVSVNFEDNPDIQFFCECLWQPPVDPTAKTEYEARKDEYRAATTRAYHEARVKTVKERVKLAGQVLKRPSSELRVEERTSIYERLIGQLTKVDIGSAHLSSELIRALFDVDKMLYFVAQDWWLPRKIKFDPWKSSSSSPKSPDAETIYQSLGPDDKQTWGGSKAGTGSMLRSNYLITEDSEPAPVGASLGWLIQLDGDNHRNAFINSPFVKAVIPIRPGRERAAINWLKLAHVEGADNLDASYGGPEPEFKGKTIEEALEALAHQIEAAGNEMANTLATETVYETGFDPLEGGFRVAEPFQVFDQWIEVLPTDQVVAVEYEPSLSPD